MVKRIKRLFQSRSKKNALLIENLQFKVSQLEEEIAKLKEQLDLKNQITKEQIEEQKQRKEVYRNFYAYGEPTITKGGVK